MAIVASKPKAIGIKALRITASRISAVISDAICRWFSNFNGVDSYAQFTDDIVLAGNFKIWIEISPILIKSATVMSFAGRRLFINESAGIRLQGGGVDISAAYDGISSDIVILQRESGVVSLYLASNPAGVVSASSGGDYSALRIGYNVSGIGGADAFDGQLSNLKITDNGTKIVDMPMDEHIKEPDTTLHYINQVTGLVGAIGFNITTEQDPVCAGLIWIDGEGWVDDDRWTD